MQLSQKEKTFSVLFFFFVFFFLHFGNLNSILNIFSKGIPVIADVIFNLGTPNNVVR